MDKLERWEALIATLVGIFTDMDERKEEREESLAFMQAPSYAWKHIQ
jgi:hypothetical protein